MKIIVDEMPTTPHQCSFAELPSEIDKPIPLPNCQLKCNTLPMTYGHGFSYTPSHFTCSLCAGKKCEFLREQEK